MILNLQYLRAFAAINVVLFHIIGTATAYGYKPNFFSYLEGWGSNGVDIFFVISGFVMYYIQYHKKRSSIEFFKLRLVRILPMYWFVTFIVIAAMYSLPSTNFNNSPPEFQKIIESLFFLSGAMSKETPIVYVGWTLEWEILFYLIISFSLFFKTKFQSIGFVILTLFLISYFSREYIVLEFLYGMLVAFTFFNFKLSKNFGLILFILGFTLLILTLALDFDKQNRFLFWGGPSMLIVLGAVFAPQINNRFMRYLGDSSYSIYLIQMLTIPLFYKILSKFRLFTNTDLLTILCLLVSIFGGVLMYKLIEKPISQYLSSKF